VKGYWGKPEATAQTFTDGWLHSGDIARIDEEGFVSIVDRAKDMLIRGGENVCSVEVEAATMVRRPRRCTSSLMPGPQADTGGARSARRSAQPSDRRQARS
jgi:acyl-CoA synthetase (AMP-forming)/AMP-acid ligase II